LCSEWTDSGPGSDYVGTREGRAFEHGVRRFEQIQDLGL
jgi:hypothetical protein